MNALNLTGTEKVLEIGAGTGRSIASIIQHASSVWLLDPSIHMLKQAKKKFPKAKVVLGYAERLPFDGVEFDRVIAIDSLHHWDNQLVGLKEISRVLDPKNGLSVIVEFDPGTQVGHYIRSMETFLRMGSSFFSPKDLRDLHTQAQLKVLNQAYIEEGTYMTISRKKV
jgi:ubiquinone/menaquinone biosynthesis C-methylase UbiE